MKNLENSLDFLLKRGVVWSSEQSTDGTERGLSASFGSDVVDSTLPGYGLSFGSIHEFFFQTGHKKEKQKQLWQAPLTVIASLVASGLRSSFCRNPSGLFVVWIGTKTWPYRNLLEETIGSVLDEIQDTGKKHWALNDICLFIDAASAKERSYCTLKSLTSPAVSIVISNAKGFSALSLRKLSLAARKNNSLGILVRPPWEVAQNSPADSKWRISPVEVEESVPCWNLEVLKAKGLSHPLSWYVQSAGIEAVYEPESIKKSNLNFFASNFNRSDGSEIEEKKAL